MFDGVVPVWDQMSTELFIGQDGGLFESVHSFSDFDETVACGVEVGLSEAIFLDDLGGLVTTMHLHVLEDRHGGSEEKIFNVAGTVASAAMGIGDDAVDVQFGVGDSNRWGTYVLIGVQSITADCHADAVDFGFSWSYGTDVSGVGDFAIGRDLGWQNEEHGVVAEDPLMGRS